MISATKFFGCLLILTGLAEADDRKLTFEKVSYNGSKGKAENCGPGNFSFEWEPEVIHTSGYVVTELNMIAAVGFDNGSMEVILTKPDEQKPILVVKEDVTCKDFAGFMIGKCPILQNDRVKRRAKLSDLSRFPQGTFIISVKITNSQKQLFMCFKVMLTIED